MLILGFPIRLAFLKTKEDLDDRKVTPRSCGDFASHLRERLDPRQLYPFSQSQCQGGENGEAPPEQGGFMGGIMGKANALKAKAAETAAAAGAGNLQVSVEIF